MNILLVYPVFPDTFWSFKHALRFVRKRASTPPLGLITVAALLPNGWKKRLVDMNVETLQDTDIQWADMVFVSAMVVQRSSTYEVIHRCKIAGKIVVANRRRGVRLFHLPPWSGRRYRAFLRGTGSGKKPA